MSTMEEQMTDIDQVLVQMVKTNRYHCNDATCPWNFQYWNEIYETFVIYII